MVSKFEFNNTQAVLFNPDMGRGRVVRELFYGIGIEPAREIAEIDQLRQCLDSFEPDLLILDLDARLDAVCRLIHEIRHGETGSNPFVVILTLTWQSERGLVNVAINAGTDDIVIMPVSLASLSARLENLIEHRREFVVTPSYVGPDRRVNRRPASDELGTFAVPNSLRFKTTGDETAAPSPATLKAARQTTTRHRLHRITTRVAQLATEIERYSEEGGSAAEMRSAKEEILALLDQMSRELDPQDYHHLLQLGRSMRHVMAQIASSPAPGAQMFEMFRLHGQAMTASLTFATGAADLVVMALDEATEALGQTAEQVAI